MRIAIAWSQVDERWGQRLASALVGRGLAVQTASVDENGVQEDDAESGPSSSVLRASAIVIPVLSASAGASRRMERLCRQVFDLTCQDWRRIVLPLVVDQLSEDDVWPFLRELPCIVARDSSPSGIRDTIARALRLLALPPSEQEPTASANLTGTAPLDLLIQGKSLLLQGRATDAQTRLEQATRLDSKLHAAWLSLGDTYDQLGQFPDALRVYDRAISLLPRDACAWAARGITLHQMDRYREALVATNRAVILDPSCALAWRARANAFSDLSQPESALLAFERALEHEPDDAVSWIGKAHTLSALGRHDDAVGAWKRAAELAPDYPPAWTGLGTAYNDVRHHREALDAYEQAITLDERLVSAWSGKECASAARKIVRVL